MTQSAPTFWKDPPWWFQDFILALVVGALLLGSQWVLEGRAFEEANRRAAVAADLAERRDNLRFVREHSSRSKHPTAAARGFPPLPFSGIDLRDQVLRGLVLPRSNFARADLRAADVSRVNLEESSFVGARAERAIFLLADLEGSRLLEADLRLADLDQVDAEDAHFDGADLRGADLDQVNAKGATFFGADLRGTRLRNASLQGASLVGADLSSADLEEANLRGATLAGSRIEGTNFNRACYDEKTIWPAGFVPETAPNACGVSSSPEAAGPFP